MASTQTETKTKKNAKAPKASRRNAVGDFLVAHLDGALMRKFIADKKIDIEVDGVDDEQVAVALVMWFKENTAKDDWVRCDVCSAVSSADLDSCPFCGDSGEVEATDDDDAIEERNASDRSDVDEPDPINNEDDARAALDDQQRAEADEEGDDEDDEDEDEDDSDDEDDDDDDDDDAPADDDVDEPATDVEAIAAAPSEPVIEDKKTTKKEDAKMTTTSAHTNGTSTKKGSTALARASRTEVVTAKDLDKAVSEVARLSKEISESIFDAAESHYQLGKKLLEMNEGQLWKMRVDPDTKKPAYKSWDQFVTRELNMSPQQSYAAIDIARGYDSSDTLRAIGQTKAWRILQAAPQDRAALIEEAKQGATVRQINTKVQKSRKKHGSPKKDKVQAKAGAKSAANAKSAAAATRPEKVSVTSFEGTKTVKLYAKPESMRNVDLSACKRAKSIADKPFGRIELANGLVQTLYLSKDAAGELVVKIETKRDE